MPGSAQNILMSGAWMWIAPVGEPDPDEASIDGGEDWGGNWDWMGWTTEPLSENYDITTATAEVQQESAPVLESITGEGMNLTTSLAEQEATTRQILDGGNITTVPASTGQPGYTLLEAGGRSGVLPRYKFGFEVLYRTNAGLILPLRIFYHVATVRRAGATQYGKGVVAATPIQITVLADPSQSADERLYRWQKVTAPAT